MNKIVFKIAESYVAIDDIILNQQKWRNFALLPNNQIINNNYIFANILLKRKTTYWKFIKLLMVETYCVFEILF